MNKKKLLPNSAIVANERNFGLKSANYIDAWFWIKLFLELESYNR
jgi:hypothetical protein